MDPDLAWLAGIIDGEGSIGLLRRAKTQNAAPVLKINIYSSSPEILGKVREVLYRHSISFTEHQDARTARPGSVIQFCTSSSIALYPLIRPHLVRLVAQYDAAVDFMSTYQGAGLRTRWSKEARDRWDNLRAIYHPARTASAASRQ